MPNRDGTGPQGEGSKTGRGFGECLPEVKNQGFLRGQGCRGRRSGRSNGRRQRRGQCENRCR